MINRKKIQLLLCTLCILHTLGNGGRALASNAQNLTDEVKLNSTKSAGSDSQFDKSIQEGTLSSNVESSTENSSVYSTEISTAYSESATLHGYSRATEDDEGISVENNTSTVATTTLSDETTTLSDSCGDTPSIEILGVSGTDTTLIVSWELTTSSDECILQYNITWYSDSALLGTGTVDSTGSNYTISDLTPCTSYNISVFAVGNNSESVAKTFTGNTTDLTPGAISDLTIVNTTGYSVYFTWSAPTSNPTCVTSYKIIITNEDKISSEIDTDVTYHNATDLTPCLNYTFTVSAVGNTGSSSGMSETAGTSQVTPGVPQEVEITPGNFSLFVSWEPPSTGSKCVSGYRVAWWPDESSNAQGSSKVTDTNITLSDLSACENYTVQVIAASDSADSLPVMAEGETSMSVNYAPTLAIETPDVTNSTIFISWNINTTMNECKLKNIHTTCNFISTDGRNITQINGQSEDDISDFSSSTSSVINITVSNLSPFSLYNCTGSTENVAGYSENSTVVTARTSEDVPSAPVLDVDSIQSTTFEFIWSAPWYLPGNLIGYEISLSWEQVFLKPSFCVYNVSSPTEILDEIEGSVLEYPYSGGTAYSNYTAKIRAKTNAGWGDYSEDISFQTAPDVPGAVTNVTYLNTSNAENPNTLDAFIFWQLPCFLNGEIEYFRIDFNGFREKFKDHTDSKEYSVNESINADRIFDFYFEELKAEYTYTFNISAKVANVSVLGPPASYIVTYPAGLPPWPEDWYMDRIKMYPYNIERTSSTTWILLPLFMNTNGEIKYYAIMISELGENHHSESRMDILGGSWPNTTTWQEAMSHSPIVTYQATPTRWDPSATNNIEDYGVWRAVKFNLGANESCSELSTRSYCNGPLRPEKLYQVRMRAFTNGGYRDSEVIIVKTKAEFNLGMVIGVVFGILFLGIITTMMLLVRKGVLQTVVSNILNRSAPGSPGPDPLPRKKFELHCQELIDNPGKLSNEFQLLQTLSVDLEMSATAAELQANRKKNRYINILPYDISRVKLEVLNNDPNSDYINASLIQGYSGGTEYIACQGPKEETTYDFWRMIYEYNVKIIVMVTQLVEKGKDKCYQYYPNARESFTHEEFTIRCSTQLDFVFYTQRTITLQKEDTKRTVVHLHFKEWSDHGVPDDVHSMINFCQLLRKQINEHKSLAVVHCSAGVGRTGTLIALDILLQQIKDNRKLDVFGTVYRLRQHRMNMVQTESQYAFIYDCTKQALSNPYPPKQYKASSVEPVYENMSKKRREITDSNTNLVASAETLKKISPSASSGSLDPICEITMPQRPIYTTQLSTLSLRYSKSTSAINSSVPPNLEFTRYGSHEYPIFEPAPDSPLNKVDVDMDRFFEFAKPVNIETRISPPEEDESTDRTIHGFSLNY